MYSVIYLVNVHRFSADIIVRSPGLGKAGKDQLSHTISRKENVRQFSAIRQAWAHITYKDWEQIPITRTTTILTEVPVPPQIIKCVRALARYFTRVARAEGVVARTATPEYIIALHGDVLDSKADYDIGSNMIRVGYDPLYYTKKLGELKFLFVLYHELRHRINRKVIYYKTGAPKDDYELTHHLGKIFAGSDFANTWEELFAIGYSAEHFYEFLQMYLPEYVDDFKKVSIIGKDMHEQQFQTNERDLLRGIGTITHCERANRGKDLTLTIFSGQETSFYIYRELSEFVPGFVELLEKARLGEPGTLGLLFQTISAVYGKDLYQEILFWPEPRDKATYTRGIELWQNLREHRHKNRQLR